MSVSVPDFTIRRAVAEDLHLVVALLNLSFYADVLQYGHCPAYGKPDEETLPFITNGTGLLAFCGTAPIGFVSVMPTDTLNEYTINRMAVLPAYWRCGVGRELMRAAESSQPLPATFVLTTPVNKASNQSFYRSLGYVPAANAMDIDNPLTVFKKTISAF